MKKTNIPFLVLVPVLLLTTGCKFGKSEDDPTKTNITVTVFDGTCRTEYMDNCARRFEAAHANDSFEAGKTGVVVKVKSVANVPNDANSLQTSDSDIFLDENKPNIYSNAHEGLLMNINDVVNPIKSKIDANCLNGCIGDDGNYYALPHYSWYTGLTYNKSIFSENLLYFADPAETSAVVPTALSSYYDYDTVKFISKSSAKKSVGPDGVANTDDDGLPSSLQEFAIWCAYANSKGVYPFRMAAQQPTYAMYITHGLWSALAGEEKMKAFYQNYTTTAIEVVKKDASGNTILKNEDLFFAGSGIKAPETESIVINENNGYRAFDMVERYYSIAFLEFIYAQKWIYTGKDSNDTHLYAMNDFINGSQVQTDKRSAILCDASYWYHEAKTYVDQYKATYGEAPDVSYMALPVKFKGSVTQQAVANKQTLMNVGSSYVYVNAKTAEDAGRKAAVTSFLSFMYSDDELKAFSELTGLQIPVTYTYSTENQDTYYKNLSTTVSKANVVQFASNSNIFKLNKSEFTLYYNSKLTELTIGGVQYPSKSYMGPLKDGHTTSEMFDAGCMNAGRWNSLKRAF